MRPADFDNSRPLFLCMSDVRQSDISERRSPTGHRGPLPNLTRRLGAGSGTTLITSFVLWFDGQGSLYFLVLFIVFFIVGFIAAYIVLRISNARCVRILDAFEEDPEVIARIGGSGKFMTCTVVGFGVAHPSCLDWTFLRSGVEQWPEDPAVWFTFAKFVAIYPSEAGTLQMVAMSTRQRKLRGMPAGCLKHQYRAIEQQREAVLSPTLKGKLDALSKKTSHAKMRLRHVWDVVIQGHVWGVEGPAEHAEKSIARVQAEYERLLLHYPNNRFVLRACSKFDEELRANYGIARTLREQARLLQRGVKVTPDRAHELGLEALPALPDVLLGGMRAETRVIMTWARTSTTLVWSRSMSNTSGCVRVSTR